MPAITTFAHRYYSQEGSTYSGSISTQIAKFLKSLPKIWAASLLMYAICLFSTFWANDVTGATIIIAIIGIPWGISGWVPFTLIGEYVSTINGNELGQNDDYVAIRTSEEDDTLGKHVRRRSRGLSENESEYDEEHSSSETRPQSSSFGRRHRKKHKLDAGIIIGIHNIYIVIPQFVSTLLNAIIFALFQAVSPDSENDEVGWVLRISGIFAIISAGFAWKVIIVSGGRRGTVAFGGH
ncbi:hypothetical protein HK098_004593 [Nowakowskiella sp. JEL0407]|nr:hypothetical protein HK098_004593 [Nowakowskiella sp. JEL0407]